MKKSIAVFFSGFGSNLEVFLQNKEQFKKVFAVGSNPKAYGWTRVKEHKVSHLLLPKPIEWPKLHEVLLQESCDFIFLAGFMKILPSQFVEDWEGKLFNLHPSLLPKYKGLKAIEQAYQAGDDIGVSIHHVTAELDAGPLVDQQLAVQKEDLGTLSLDQVKQRVHKLEHQMVTQWIQRFS